MTAFCFIGMRPACGCVTFWMALEAELLPGDVEALSAVVESGRRIFIVPDDEGKRRLVTECPHKTSVPERELAA